MPAKPPRNLTVRLPAPTLAEATAAHLGTWATRALCAGTDPEIFFPPHGDPASRARQICGQCAVTSECLAYALENREEYGIWGGLDPGERRKLRDRRAAGSRAARRRQAPRGAA